MATTKDNRKNVRMSPEVHQELRTLALTLDMTLTELIPYLIDNEKKNLTEKQYKRLKAIQEGH